MPGKKYFFHQIDENKKGKVKLGDGSIILYEGTCNISVTFKMGEVMIIHNVIY